MKVNFLGVGIDNQDQTQVLNQIQEYLMDGKKHDIVTPNPEMIVIAQKDLVFREILNKADLAIPDGIGIVWLARLLGIHFPERITGTDLAEKMCKLGNQKNYRFFLLGGEKEVGEQTKQYLEKKYSGIQIAGISDGDSRIQADDENRKTINLAGPIDILLVAFGAPCQEKWIARNLPYLNVKLAMGVGGAFDYYSGKIKRAPLIMQKSGFEWLYRLLKEPWRLKRQLRLPLFVLLVLKAKLGLFDLKKQKMV